MEMDGANRVQTHDLRTILSGDGRDFLVRNNGDKVNVGDLEGKTVGIYFSAHWCPPCRRFTPKLAEAYAELSPRGFKVVFVSADEDEASFQEYFSQMPWLAVPFSDSATRDSLDQAFEVNGIPHLVVLDGSTGRVLTEDGVEIVREYGTEGFPFTSERVAELKEEEAAAKRNQTLYSVLASPSRDFVIKSNGDKVPIADLEGKTVCLYFSAASYPPCAEFTPLLTKAYEELKNRGEPFEVVLVSLERDEDDFKEDFKGMPWPALPVKDRIIEKLPPYFELSTLPTLVVVGPDGKTLQANAAELVEEHGAAAYPFSAERVAELEEMERARREAQTLESLLVSGELDYVIAKDGHKVPVSELVGKNILLYFSAHWCPPCRGFTPRLIQVYHEIMAKDSAFEVVFISSDHDQSSFEEYFSGMPWLALPFGDPRKKSLSSTFKIMGIPSLVAIGPSGRTATTEARDLVEEHGAKAYPFTEERVEQLGQGMERDEEDAMEDESGEDGGDADEKEAAGEGYICEGDVCRRV
ncbi:hypothetical protein Taro_012591 [Colocasia esculenta]|uniref:protein-disulfide reductase n=1 Tax=Colocasia esculenta TaxID=4460 RepID=A0A843UDZ7_COLES|nr:hypothetical protein [Colocasia esculenta]